jgi:hypothetical protein
MRWSEAGYLSRIVLAHAPRQASVSLIFDVRQNEMRARYIIWLGLALFLTEADAGPRRPAKSTATTITFSPDAFPEGLPVARHEKVQLLDFPDESFRNLFQTLSTFYDVRITCPRELAETRFSLQVADADLFQILEQALASQGYRAKLRGRRDIRIIKNEPNKAVEPTPVDVTPDASASVAPSTSAGHL